MKKQNMADIPPEAITLRDMLLSTMLVFLPDVTVDHVIGDSRNRKTQPVAARFALLYLLELTRYRFLVYKQLGLLIGITNADQAHRIVVYIHSLFSYVPPLNTVRMRLIRELIDKTYFSLEASGIFIVGHKVFNQAYRFDPQVTNITHTAMASKQDTAQYYPIHLVGAALLVDQDGELITRLKYNFLITQILEVTNRELKQDKNGVVVLSAVEKVLNSMRVKPAYVAKVKELLLSVSACAV